MATAAAGLGADEPITAPCDQCGHEHSRGEPACQDEPPPTAQLPDYRGDLWSRPYLTGDWSGLRSSLAESGITFQGMSPSSTRESPVVVGTPPSGMADVPRSLQGRAPSSCRYATRTTSSPCHPAEDATPCGTGGQATSATQPRSPHVNFGPPSLRSSQVQCGCDCSPTISATSDTVFGEQGLSDQEETRRLQSACL